MQKNIPIPATPLRYLISMVRPDSWRLTFTLFFAGFGQLLDLVFAVYLGYLVDVLSKAHNTASLSLWLLVGLYPTIVLGQAVSMRIAGFVMNYVEHGVNKRSYLTLFKYLADHGMEYFSNRFAGAVSNKINSATRGTTSILRQFVWSYWTLGLTLIASFGYTLSVDWKIASVVLGAAFIIVPANLYFARKKAVLSEHAENLRTKLRGATVDTISNIAAVIHFARRKNEYARIEVLANESYKADVKSDFFSELLILGNAVALFFFSVAVLFLSLYLWSQGSMTGGTLIALLMVMSTLLWSLMWVGNQMNNYAESYGEVQNGLNDIIVPHDIEDAQNAKCLLVPKGEVRFDGMKFSYGESVVFEDFNLTIKPGARVGLVGPSGAGKTTLIALLLRNNDPDDGAILIDGQDIKAVAQDSLNEAVAIVPQESVLFHRSIADNIAYGKPDATDTEIEEAAKKAQAHEFIMATKDGYKTLVGERGVKLSGGQRQRVAIARAILKAAPILILDEATSSLDSESEAEIQLALKELMKGKTVIAIAHRLSTIRAMDRIIVMENGKIVEDGTHDALLQITGGLYARLWAHQAGGFLEE